MGTDVNQWVVDYQNGNSVAKEKLFKYLYPRLRKKAHGIFFLRNCTLDPTDILHDAMIKLERKKNLNFNNYNAFEAFLVRLVKDCLIAYIRRRESRGRVKDQYTQLNADNPMALEDVPYEKLIKSIKELEQQQPLTARVFIMRYLSLKPSGDICQSLGINEYRYRAELEYGKSWLKSRL